jgi:lysophospholipase L1-like esterase
LLNAFRALLIGFLISASSSAALAQTAAPVDPDKFEPDIRKFDDADRAAVPPAGGIVFTGSSSIRLWTSIAQDFPGVATINRGFGGSEISDAIRYVDRIVIRYRPSQVVFYSGDNDLNGGKSPAQVAAGYKTFVDAIHAKLPRTRIVIISIKPSLARWALVDKMRDTNRRVQELVGKDSTRLAFVDVFTPMLGADGRPRPELYVDDGLHMTPAGYEIWKNALAPVLTQGRSSRMPAPHQSHPRGLAPRTARHALSRAASPARSARVARSPCSLAPWSERRVCETAYTRT